MPDDTLVDFITGESVPNMGAEANRQAVERLLVEKKGYRRDEITVDFGVAITVAGSPYRSRVDLVVALACTGRPESPVQVLAFKCAAGSLGSREREILAAARIANDGYQIPLAVATDGKTAIVLDTVSGKRRKEGLRGIPSRREAVEMLASLELHPLPPKRRDGEKLIFRSYDSENINRVGEL